MIKMILISISLLTFFACDEAEEALQNSSEFGIEGTYEITDAMLYPNPDCSGTPVSGVCMAADSIMIEADCPDSSWMSYMSEFDEWNMIFIDDNQTVVLDDGYEADTLTYTFDATTLIISDSDSTSETITIAISSDNNTLEANLNAEASCSITYDNMGAYDTEDACIDAGHEWDPALCIGLVLTLTDTNDENSDETDEDGYDDGPPACVEDCPDFNLLSDCDYDDEDCDANADCTIIASWDGTDCFSDCEGDDADEVNMVLQTCISCIDDETDCADALDDIYDEYNEGPPACVEDCPDFNLLSECDYDDEDCEEDEEANCVIVASWDGNDCFSDCEGDDADEVNMVLQTCIDCIANETDCEEALEDIYDDYEGDDLDWPEAPACIEDCENFDILNDDNNVTNTGACEVVSQWNACSSDCSGEDLALVTEIITWCTECLTNDTCDEEDISFSDNPLEGAWDTISSMFNMSITMDLSIVIANTDEEDCVGTYSDSTCVVDEGMMQTISLSTCNIMDGILDGFLCSFNMSDSTYFTEGDTLNYQMIDIEGENLTITDIENGVEDVSSGTIMTYENIVEWTVDGEPTMTGTYEIVEPSTDMPETANLFFVFPDNAVDILMMMDDEDFDENFAMAITEIYGSSEIMMSRITNPAPQHPPK